MQRSAILAVALMATATTAMGPLHPKDTSRRGGHTEFPEAICFNDDSKPAKCYMDTETAAYNKGKAVFRILKSGRGHCTGWALGSEGHVMTNHHCVSSQADADTLEWEVMAEGSCKDECQDGSDPACTGTERIGGLTFIKADPGLDYALLQLPEDRRQIIDTMGHLSIRGSAPQVGERIYVVQHPAGWGKRLAMEVDNSTADLPLWSEIVAETVPKGCSWWSVGHNADTQGGSSGSPVLSHAENVVVALHNCGGCSPTAGGNNWATPGHLIVKQLTNLGLMPKDGRSDTVGPVCAPGCEELHRGDGFCDASCNVAACGMDDGDCADTCSPGCTFDMHNDGGCDLACNTTACDSDKGTCLPICAEGCAYNWPGDNYCDAACNNAECDFDGGDCGESCDDGLMNGGETQRDCGGPDCPACGDNCPFLDVTDHADMLGCADGTQCNKTDLGWGCCVADHGGRAVCPPTHMYMCAQDNVCGGGEDFCCAPTVAGCDGAGGIMLCRAEDAPYHMGDKGTECPLGQEILDLADCKAALSQLNVSVAEDMWWAGDYQLLPAGCSYRAPNGKLSQGHFNSAPNGKGHVDRSPVCKKNTSPYELGALGSECAEAAMIVVESECKAAMQLLGLNAEPMWTGSYSQIPGGCSYRADAHSGLTRGHFNTHSTHQGHASRHPICKKQ